MRYDVVRDYDWTISPRRSGLRNSAPKAVVKSYRINTNQINQAIRGYINIIEERNSDNAFEFYEKMYQEATDAEDDFNFPMFSDNIRSFSNTFGDSFSSPTGGTGGILGGVNDLAKTFVGGAAELYNIAGGQEGIEGFKGRMEKAGEQGGWKGLAEAFKGQFSGRSAPGTYIETPMFYQYDKTDGPLQVNFILSNTINNDSLVKNRELIDKLTRINRPLRKNSIAVEPPRIYQVRVPGHRFIRWAYCSSFSVDFVGTRREINGVIEPEAYMVSMTFQSLTLEHAGFMDRV